VLLDFDGTLASREGIWSGCVLEVLDSHLPGHGLTVERIRAAMTGRYLWNTPAEPHLHLCEPDSWWTEMQGRIAAALLEAGLAPGADGATLARAVRERFLDATVGWSLFPDTVPALQSLRTAGWRTGVLSNHVPELAELARALGVHELLDAVFTSGLSGYEKPHSEAFRIAVDAFGDPEQVWMVGDSVGADVDGAEALGIPAVLVRTTGEVARHAEDLLGAVELILAG
jgi:putative hydrolase of the HAD superfamily